ncbi:hypothetical protein Atai01_82460 [Amycolatopsis taiwanensis]|uniref:Uncharacterized protein n=1 Tax=Amycolatopsis taiwanensis TaxID=342230 RepID=A0A9W6RCL6_9PSEU|nr:hypothetical protein Atai01_82460 [Amycolatopsis taiwanensis]
MIWTTRTVVWRRSRGRDGVGFAGVTGISRDAVVGVVLAHCELAHCELAWAELAADNAATAAARAASREPAAAELAVPYGVGCAAGTACGGAGKCRGTAWCAPR